MKRVILGLAVLALVLLVGVILRPEPPASVSTVTFGISTGNAPLTEVRWPIVYNTQPLADAMRTLHALELRDSLVPALRADSTVNRMPFRVLVRGQARTSGDSARFSDELQRQWRGLDIQRPRHAMIVVVHLDSITPTVPQVSQVRSVSEADGYDVVFAPPRRDSRDPCITLIRIAVASVRSSEEASPRDVVLHTPMLSACAYYAAFGQPGAGIDRWLTARDFDIARTAWTVAAQRSKVRPRASHYLMFPLFIDSNLVDEGISAAVFTAAQRCADGNSSACRDLVLDSTLRTPDTLRPLPSAGFGMNRVDTTATPVPFYNPGGWSVRIGQEFLAALVREAGRDRFARFWQSEAAPAVAFENAMGEPIGDWTRDWVQHTTGYTVRGTQIPVTTTLIAIVMASLGLVVSVLVANRRSVR